MRINAIAATRHNIQRQGPLDDIMLGGLAGEAFASNAAHRIGNWLSG